MILSACACSSPARESTELQLEEDLGAAEGPLTVRTVNGVDDRWSFNDQVNLTYCVDRVSFGSRAEQAISAIEQATQLWSRRANLGFRRLELPSCSNKSKEVSFDVVYKKELFLGAFADSFWPSEERDSRELLVSESAFTTTENGRDLVGILSHELGHALGFRHEHIWINPGCTKEKISDDEGGGARLLTGYDVNSVMHYPQCRPGMSGGYRPSETDYVGAIKLYGLAPALTYTTVLAAL